MNNKANKRKHLNVGEIRNVHCTNCHRWYRMGVDQCEVPDCGIDFEGYTSELDEPSVPYASFRYTSESFNKAVRAPRGKVNIEGQQFMLNNMRMIHRSTSRKIYGHPSELNKNNNCIFFRPTVLYCINSLFYNLFRENDK